MSPDTAIRSLKTPCICERLNMDKRWMSGVLIVAHTRNPNSPGPLCVTKINAPSKGRRRNAATLFKPTCICTLPTTHKNKRSSMRTTSLFRSGLQHLSRSTRTYSMILSIREFAHSGSPTYPLTSAVPILPVSKGGGVKVPPRPSDSRSTRSVETSSCLPCKP
jgi:hypothetical protein